ncbi:hypothetical protein E2C01_004323 [Portunus trituberculatus]|uniref:Uncharacterized protein n=1 Tax=Portunus trituberculatus TaxID=210409 RepID=A0A5B7CPN6_PORTR|nr:hypothetical protein [Portunus trituberculatus]
MNDFSAIERDAASPLPAAKGWTDEIRFVCLRCASCLACDTDGVCLARVAGVSQLERINRVATIYGGHPPPSPCCRLGRGKMLRHLK